MGTKLVAKHRLPDSQMLWVTNRSHVQSSEEKEWMNTLRPGRTRSERWQEVEHDKETVSALVLIDDPAQSSAAIIEIGE